MIIAATGHRPEKLGGYAKAISNKLIAAMKVYVIEQPESVSEIISGMALGFDTAVAITALDLKIPLTAAIPFRGQETPWPKESKDLYHYILSRAHRAYIVCHDGYAPWKMQVRNQWMVDNCDKVCALWDGSPGGTANCIRYANSVGKPVDNIWERWQDGMRNSVP